ncbi:MAG: hypothetical protein R3C03_07420 [Pirellulaceae bacterium]
MIDSDLLHIALYYALLDIRNQGRERNDKIVFHLANLFHNVVVQMGDAAKGKREYSDVLRNLKETAQRTGCQQWLNNVIAQIEHKVDRTERGNDWEEAADQ